MHTLAFIPNLGPPEMIIIMVVALLLFGKRLPEVGKSLGRGIVEFKRGVKGITDEIESESDQSGASSSAQQNASGEQSGHKGWESIEPSRLEGGEGDRRVGQGERPAEAPMSAEQADPSRSGENPA